MHIYRGMTLHSKILLYNELNKTYVFPFLVQAKSADSGYYCQTIYHIAFKNVESIPFLSAVTSALTEMD